MASYKAPVDETLFLLNDVLGFAQYADLPGFADATPDLIAAIMTEGGKFAEEVLAPLNEIGDRQGCVRQDDATVTTPEGFVDAYSKFADAGWVGLAGHPDYGGQGLPATLAAALNEYFSAANMAWSMYPGLSQGAIAALTLHGSEDQKSLYLPKMMSGAWSGTMNLTEQQCGTDLGLIRTKAEPAPDGSYKISGTKVFISAGEHDLTENIVHLVLARIDGAPEGTKGISLFVVPKYLPNETGDAGERNRVSCGSLERKMGIHGNATCVMNYDQATGWLVGMEHKGLRAMFTMMNEARLGVGIQGLAQSDIAYQNAANYARERGQGRALSGPKAPDKLADPIIVHPDIRRILMTIRSVNEAGRALVLWTALRGDVARRSDDDEDRQAADDMMGLLTPVIKGVLTDRGFENAVAAQQVFGGHGYIADVGMEQFVRDARIAMIYEGANGIQALDLVGRKLPANGGRAIMAFFSDVSTYIKERDHNELLRPYLNPLQSGLDDLQKATLWFKQNTMSKPDNVGAGSTDYMHLLGLVALGYMWVQMAEAAHLKTAERAGDTDFYEAKLVLARFFMERLMPETAVRLARISTGADTLLDLPAEAF